MRTSFVRSILVVMALAGVYGASPTLAQHTRPRKQPHTAVDHPDFVAASLATFASNRDVLIGVAKAYLAADVGQHGIVHDQMADGPIAVT